MSKPFLSQVIYFLVPFVSLTVARAQTFTTPLLIPDTLSGPVFNLTMDTTKFVFFPGGDSIATYSFNKSGYLGPTIMWYKGTNSTMNVTNNLGGSTTLHWHGAHVPPRDDGGPHDTIAAGVTWSPKFNIMDNACTMWYHPHLHMETMDQVQMGLAGLIIIRDPGDPYYSQLPRTYGVDEFPLIIQDREFIYDSISGDTIIRTDCSLGHTLLVNGVPNPVLHVPAQNVRFHLLNGSSERVYYFGLDKNTSFKLIATDAGYTSVPYLLDSMIMAPGERSEWIIDLKGREGDTLYLMNYPNKLGLSVPGGRDPNAIPGCYQQTAIDSFPVRLMKIVVGAATANPVSNIPASFGALDIPDPLQANRLRTKRFYLYNPNPNAPPFSIDSLDFDMMLINDTVTLGDIEVWTLINVSTVAHPFHIHDVHFFMLDINGDPNIPLYLKGPKDVVLVNNNDTIRFVTQFLDFASPVMPENSYMYHCHILSHEDGGMMHQFVVKEKPTGVMENSPGIEWDIFPNPASGEVFISGESAEASRVRVLNTLGEICSEVSLPSFSSGYAISLPKMPAGLYFIQWIRKDGVHARRLLIRN